MKFVNQGMVGSPTNFIGTQAQASSLPGATVLQDQSVPEGSMPPPGSPQVMTQMPTTPIKPPMPMSMK